MLVSTGLMTCAVGHNNHSSTFNNNNNNIKDNNNRNNDIDSILRCKPSSTVQLVPCLFDKIENFLPGSRIIDPCERLWL